MLIRSLTVLESLQQKNGLSGKSLQDAFGKSRTPKQRSGTKRVISSGICLRIVSHLIDLVITGNIT